MVFESVDQLLDGDAVYFVDSDDDMLDDFDDYESFVDITEDDGILSPGLPDTCTSDKVISTESTAIACIESALGSLLEAIMYDKPLTLNLRSRRYSASGSVYIRTMSFPGQTREEAWRFTVTLRVLELIHEALTSGIVTTMRDIYYKDPALFMKQRVVNRIVDDIACTFGVPRSALSVSAASKGLAAGCFSIIHSDMTELAGTSDREGMLIPELSSSDIVPTSNAKWVLVVEKEAIFRSLVSSEFWEDIVREGIIVTGKGYPDINTRATVRHFAEFSLHRQHPLPICGLVDFDPDGVGILSTYKHGSISLAHENSALTTPRLKWLGIRSADITKLDGDSEYQKLVELSSRDRRKAMKLLERDHFDEKADDSDWRLELQIMMTLNFRAEIQALEPVRGLCSLVPWLRSRLRSDGILQDD